MTLHDTDTEGTRDLVQVNVTRLDASARGGDGPDRRGRIPEQTDPHHGPHRHTHITSHNPEGMVYGNVPSRCRQSGP